MGNKIVAKATAVTKSLSAKGQTAKTYLGALMAMAMCATCTSRMVYADAGTDMINAILTVAKMIVRVIGIIVAIVGIVKFVMSHSEGDGPAQTKAAGVAATGVALIILPSVLDQIDFAGMING